MPSDNIIDAPLTLTGFFPAESDESDNDDDEPSGYSPTFEIQSIPLLGRTLQIRQFDHHSHNANRVWPGTFNLCEFLFRESTTTTTDSLVFWGRVLELGTATGLLAIRLAQASRVHYDSSKQQQQSHYNTEPGIIVCHSVTTSDVVDEHDEVAQNLRFNYKLNDIPADTAPIHVPHTWGTGWQKSVIESGHSNNIPSAFDTVVASDILLYVNAYPALVQTLEEIVTPNNNTRFLMSWNRRMKESQEFFARMETAGFTCVHHGKCVYEFNKSK
jgi:predicted nicotinamide N-methyase